MSKRKRPDLVELALLFVLVSIFAGTAWLAIAAIAEAVATLR